MHWVGGKTNLVFLNISIISLVLFFNITNQISENKDIMERLIYTIPFLVMIIFLLFIKSNIINSIIFLLIAIGTTIDPANISDYSGTIFFIYSFHLIKNKRYAWILSLITLSCLTIRSILVNDTIPGTLIMIAIYGYVYALYYFIIYKSSAKQVESKISELTELENKLICGMASGIHKKKIFSNMGIIEGKGYDMIKRIKEKTGTNSTEQIVYNLGKHNSSKNR